MSIHQAIRKNAKYTSIVFLSCLGFFAVYRTNASGFNGGVVVSTGNNPAFAVGGGVSSSTTTTLKTAPSDAILMVSDVVLTANPHDNCTNIVTLQTSGGATLGQFRLGSQRQNNGGGYSTYAASPDQIQHSFAFGLPVPAGESLEMNTFSSCEISYTIAGYSSVQ
jgi:hypothetical protein